MRKLYIGTSGYSYAHWEEGVFYPKDLPKIKQLEYYTRHFNTVELNNPFYRLPEIKTFSNWKKRVPKGFIFAVKVSRFITHIKRLHQCKVAWRTFLERTLHLKDKLGPFLFQFPPSFSATQENVKRLEEFLQLGSQTASNLRYVFEFRHPTWFSDDIYPVLRRNRNISLCLADSPHWPFKEIITGDFIYIRMHGGKILYGSDYSEKELKSWTGKIKKYLKQGLDIYCYFNNDAMGYAPKNAKTLCRSLASA